MSLAHATRDNPTAAAHRIGSDDEALKRPASWPPCSPAKASSATASGACRWKNWNCSPAPACGASRCPANTAGPASRG